MKKALVLLLALALAGGVFAQDLSFSGSITTGFQFKVDDEWDSVIGNDHTVPSDALDFDLNGAYNGGNWGLNFGIGKAYKAEAVIGDEVQIYDAHAWLDLLDGMITLKSGVVDPDPYSAGGAMLDDPALSNGAVFRLDAKPVDGLSVGFAFNFSDSAGAATSKNTKEFLKNTGFGFKYKADTFWVAVGARMYAADTSYTDPADDMDMAMLAGINFTGVENLTVHFSSVFDHLIGEPEIRMRMGLDVTYKISNELSVYVHSLMDIEDTVPATTRNFARIRPGVNYKLADNVTVVARVPVHIITNAADDTGLGSVGLDLWLNYAVGKAYVRPVYNLAVFTSDYGDKMTHAFGVFMGASF